MRAAARRRGPGARRGSAGLGGARARQRRRRLRSFCPRFCRRRGPAPRSAAFAAAAPAPARTSAASLSGARAGHQLALPGLVSRGSRGRRDAQCEPCAVRTATGPRARGASTRRAPSRTRTRAARARGTAPPRPAPRSRPLPHCSQPARRRRASSSPAA